MLCDTLFESTTLTGVDPYRSVLEATRRAIASPGTVTLQGMRAWGRAYDGVCYALSSGTYQ